MTTDVSWRTLYFPATKKNDSQIKCKSEKNASETAHILDQDDKKLNSERSTKFEDKYSELEQRLIVESTTEDKMKKQMQKMKKGAQQLMLEEASMMPQQQIHPESKTHHSTRAPSMQTQLPMKGPQQQTLKEESMKMMQTECEARRRMSRTKQSSEKPQLLQQVKRKHQQPPTQKHMKGLQQTCNGEEEVMQTMQEDEEEKAKELVEYTIESALARAPNEKEEISTESRHDKNEQRCEKDEEIKAHRRKETLVNMTNA